MTKIILNIYGEETFYTTVHDEPCDKCKTTLKCYQDENGGIITHRKNKGFHLWGPLGVCSKCNDKMEVEFGEALKRIQEEYNAT